MQLSLHLLRLTTQPRRTMTSRSRDMQFGVHYSRTASPVIYSIDAHALAYHRIHWPLSFGVIFLPTEIWISYLELFAASTIIMTYGHRSQEVFKFMTLHVFVICLNRCLVSLTVSSVQLNLSFVVWQGVFTCNQIWDVDHWRSWIGDHVNFRWKVRPWAVWVEETLFLIWHRWGVTTGRTVHKSWNCIRVWKSDQRIRLHGVSSLWQCLWISNVLLL